MSILNTSLFLNVDEPVDKILEKKFEDGITTSFINKSYLQSAKSVLLVRNSTSTPWKCVKKYKNYIGRCLTCSKGYDDWDDLKECFY